MTDLTLIKTNLKRNTFENKKIRAWVESRCDGKVLNLFSGKTVLDVDEVRNDVSEDVCADYHQDALDFIMSWDGGLFDAVILDPPYSYRKAMELYQGKYSSRFKKIADNMKRVLKPGGRVISFGYHSSFMGAKRAFSLEELCVFAHGGAQHCTIAIVEKDGDILRMGRHFLNRILGRCGGGNELPIIEEMLK